jgi:hypothetical protein
MSSLERMGGRLTDLAGLALDTLPEMFDERARLFSQKTVVDGGRYANREPNVLYSAVSLVGLLCQQRRPADDVLPVGTALDGAHAAVVSRDRPSELANMVWASVLAGDLRGQELLARLAKVDPQSCSTGDLGQALYGLVTGGRAYVPLRDRAERAARAVAGELLQRFSPRAEVFRASPRRSIPRRALIEGGLSSFAAQVYPLHGLAAFYLWTGGTPPDALARVAARIVEAQGPLGQWWWIYSSRSRVILEGYPVYSVHQDGMAFLGLMELERLGLGSFADELALGLDWLSGANELGTDLVEREPALVNRCIQRCGSDADGSYGISRANFGLVIGRSVAPRLSNDRTAADPSRLEVLRECRSYHLGWLLYADALVQSAQARLSGGGN